MKWNSLGTKKSIQCGLNEARQFSHAQGKAGPTVGSMQLVVYGTGIKMTNNDLKTLSRGLRNAVRSGNQNEAYKIDFYVMERLVKATDSEELWKEWQQLTYVLRLQLADEARALKAERKIEDDIPSFLIYNHSGLAHEIQLRSIIKKFENSKCRIIYAFGKPIESARQFYDHDSTEIYFLQCDPTSPFSSLKHKLQLLYQKFGPIFITVITSYVLGFWASIANHNHRFSYYAMRMIPFQVPSIDRWITGGSGEKALIYNERWEVIERPWVKTFNSMPPKGRDRPVSFGSISREAKISNILFLNAIRDILESVPSSKFIITGRTLPESVSQFFERRGLEDRIEFIGWVDPSIGLNLIDIYVEPFPFGGGLMLYEAIVNSKPFVYMADTDHSNLAITDSYLTNLFGTEELKNFRAFGYQDYVEKVILLARAAVHNPDTNGYSLVPLSQRQSIDQRIKFIM